MHGVVLSIRRLPGCLPGTKPPFLFCDSPTPPALHILHLQLLHLPSKHHVYCYAKTTQRLTSQGVPAARSSTSSTTTDALARATATFQPSGDRATSCNQMSAVREWGEQEGSERKRLGHRHLPATKGQGHRLRSTQSTSARSVGCGGEQHGLEQQCCHCHQGQPSQAPACLPSPSALLQTTTPPPAHLGAVRQLDAVDALAGVQGPQPHAIVKTKRGQQAGGVGNTAAQHAVCVACSSN